MSLRGFDYLMITCIREIKKKNPYFVPSGKRREGNSIYGAPTVCQAPCRRWPSMARTAHTSYSCCKKSLTPVRPRSLPQCESLSNSQCPQVTSSGILCTCFGSTIRSALKQKTKSESPYSPFSHFWSWWKLISVAWPRQWYASTDAYSVWPQKLGAGIPVCLGVSLQYRTIRTPRRISSVVRERLYLPLQGMWARGFNP